MDKHTLLRSLPAVGKLLHHPVIEGIFQDVPQTLLVSALSRTLGQLRDEIQALEKTEGGAHDSVEGLMDQVTVEAVAARAKDWLDARFRPHLRPVINVTGTIIHTNLGRAPLSPRALEAVTNVASGYSNLEFEIESGTRGSRHTHLEPILCEMTGAEAAIAVNNNAAAVLLVLTALAGGGEGLVSRGQLVEIGGSFRIPDIMTASGVKLVEVGTTNKTRTSDYVNAMTENTKVVLRVHTSNYRIVGFTEQPKLEELVNTAHLHDLPLFEDLGSGALFDYEAHGIGDEPTVRASIEAGADVVTFSGDKLLGGAQAGIIVGRKHWIDQMKRHPLARVLRLDKMTLAALEATLLDHLDDNQAMKQIPVVRMVTESYADVSERAAALAEAITSDVSLRPLLKVGLADGESTIGGGSFPGERLPTRLVTLRAPDVSAERLAWQFRNWPKTAIVSRVSHDLVVFDVRTLLPGQEDSLLAGLSEWADKWRAEESK